MDTQRLQEAAHGEGHDYRAGSPHLSHHHLFDSLTSIQHALIQELHAAAMPLTVLEVGAGHGGYTESLLAAGCQVVATEMSRPSLQQLNAKYGLNPGFRSVFDKDGSLDVLGDERFSLVVCASVLHHIPDYLGFIRGPVFNHIAPGGAFLSFQDPLWYPAVGPVVHWLDRSAYLLWRLPRGNYRTGMAALWRRVTGRMDPTEPSDMVEYHVLRNGVNHEYILTLLEASFTDVSLQSYWSSQAALFQVIGQRLIRPNTFLTKATGFELQVPRQ